MTSASGEFSTPAGDAVRENYRNQGRHAERELMIGLIERQVCFDALADHEAMASFRSAHPEIVGRCEHHGGKCSDLLLLIHKLKMGKI
ncbi:MAG: hypothetical protein ACR2IJ_05945 [Fluviibacter sp.]